MFDTLHTLNNDLDKLYELITYKLYELRKNLNNLC